MSCSESGDEAEVASPGAYEALRARNIAIRKRKEAQILKDAGLEDAFREKHIRKQRNVDVFSTRQPDTNTPAHAVTRSKTRGQAAIWSTLGLNLLRSGKIEVPSLT
ncbi:hypothetical protein R1sor_024541 [Riccia sorocarpa]|uniref:IBB domain-containing protein n=1 Tax=Riccia sorocarpa TaxID=122646 RepID=A0ABD3GQS8_9MARC